MDATERMNQNADSEPTNLQSTSAETPHRDEQRLAGTENGTESLGSTERVEELEALIEVLQTENERLRTDYARARKTASRKTALALVVTGIVAVLGGIALPSVRAVLFVIGAIGLFGGVMTWSLTPARVLPVSVSESVYHATTTTLTELKDELGLQALTVYVPNNEQTRGFIPRSRELEIPENVALALPDETNESQGLSFTPSGRQLTRDIDRIRTTQTPETALDAIEQTADSLAEHFEMADRILVEEGTNVGEFIISVDEPAFGPLTRLDHPIVSALACAVVQSVDKPAVVNSSEEATVNIKVVSETDD